MPSHREVSDPTLEVRWAEVSISDTEEPQQTPSKFLAVLLVVAVAYWVGGRWFGLGIAVLLLTLLVLERYPPPFLQGWFPRVRRLQRRLGARLETGLLALTWALAVLPRAYLQRPARTDRQGWIDIEDKASPNSRQFANRRRTTQRGGRLRLVTTLIGATALFLVVDVVAGSIVPRARTTAGLEDRAALTAFADAPWAEEYWRDFPTPSSWEYEPYVGWLRGDLASEYVNVVDGRRATWVSPELGESPIEVWFFGGSTMWGVGQRDDFTIASEFAKVADEAGLDLLVRNYGVGAHRLWQENLHLELRLLQGARPDLVIFYDGANEPTGHGNVDSATPTHSRVAAFEAQLEGTESSAQVVLDAWKERSLVIRGARWARQALRSDSPTPSAAPVPNSVDALVAAENILGVYEEGVFIGQDIARRRDFEIIHFWQPTLYTKTFNPDEGDAWTTRGYRTRDRDWYHSVYEAAEDRLPNGVVDVSGSLDDAPKPVFFDHTHTNELGAAIVANRLFVEVEPVLRELQAEVGS